MTKRKSTSLTSANNTLPSSPVDPVSPVALESVRTTDASKPLVWLTALFGVLAPILYTINYLFSSGYISALGLDPDLYARSPDQHIAKSIGTIANVIVDFFPNLNKWIVGIIILFLGFAIVVWVNHVLSKRLRIPQWLNRWVTKVTPAMESKSWRVLSLGFLTSFLLIYLPIAFAFIFILIVAPISAVGERAAMRAIDKFNASDKCKGASTYRHARCVSIIVGKEKPFEALLLLSSEKAIAVYDPSEKAVRSFHPKDGIEIRSVILDAPPPKIK